MDHSTGCSDIIQRGNGVNGDSSVWQRRDSANCSSIYGKDGHKRDSPTRDSNMPSVSTVVVGILLVLVDTSVATRDVCSSKCTCKDNKLRCDISSTLTSIPILSSPSKMGNITDM